MADRSRPKPGVPSVVSHYRIGKSLGGGGMGEVYKATDRRDRSTVAVKLLHPHLAQDEAFRERFEREAHVGALLRSPYTVHLLDYGFAEGRYFIAMEFVEGRSLKEEIQRGPLELRRALRIAAQAARALEEAEARGVVHRDIKPDNIMLTSGDSVKVCDFGIARQLGAGTLTMPGAFVGTLAYAAPELGLGKADHRSDIYSLGSTLYHALTGRPPFLGDPLEMLRQHADTPLPLEPLKDLPADVIGLIQRCLEKDPNKRYQSATILAGALEHAAISAPTPVPEAPAEVVGRVPAEETLAPPAELEAPTEVAATPPEAAETAPTEVKPREEPSVAGSSPATLELHPPRGGRLLGAGLGATSYELIIRNGGAEQVDLQLQAGDSAGRCSFSLPGSVSLPPNGAKTVTLKVSPRERRWRGARETCSFTVSASRGGGQPPLTISGQFDDLPYGWLPYGGLFAVGIVAAVAAAFLLIGGGGGGSNASSSLSDEDLGRMVAPKEELGPDYSAFTLDPGQSGSLSNDDLIAESCDAQQRKDGVQRSGRISGYRASYMSEQRKAEAKGAFLVSTGVEQFGDGTGARQELQAFLDDPVKALGLPECRELTTVEREEFAPGAIGEESHGIEVRVSGATEGGGKTEYTLTIVAFVRGSLVGRAMIGHFDSPDYRAQAEALARKLDQRILAVLGAPPTGSPTPTPAPSGGGSPAPTGSPSPGATGSPTPQSTAEPTPKGTPRPTPRPSTPPPAGAPAISSLGCSPSSVQTNQTIACNPSISGTVTSRSWSAPGGSPSSGSGSGFSTSYGSAGGKTITLTACNGSACSSKSQNASVTAPPPPSAPAISSVGCSPTTVQPNQTVTCNPSISGTVTSRSWSAPGGSPSSGSGGSFSTSYGSAGGKTISLTACNGAACSSKSQSITVSAPPQQSFEIYVDYVVVTTGEFVTVSVYAYAPDPGLGYYDIDIIYDASVVSAVTCTADVDGYCDPFYGDDTVNFSGYMGASGDVLIGTIDFWAGLSPGVSYLIVSVFTLEDTQGNDVSGNVDVYDGEISVQ